MKTFIKFILQKILGLKTYLYVFARFVIIKIRWDKKEKDFFYFMELIPDNGIILDLGANIGVTSCLLSRKFPQSTIYSFEPLPLNMETLKRIKKKFNLGNIQEYQVAVGEKEGEVEMVMPVVRHVPMHGLSHVVGIEENGNDNGFRLKVPMICLDNFERIHKNGGKVTGMKIDVENFEYYVLKGSEKLITEHRPVIYCELWDNENRKKCIGLLNNLGYSAFVLQKKNLVGFDMATVEKHNFFFLPNLLTN